MISRFEQFSFIISLIHRDLQKIERDEMEKMGYKGSYSHYLAFLKRYENGITSTRLSEICDKDKAAISRVITEMEQKGLIYREKDSVNDTMYRARIKLTEEGHKAADYVCTRACTALSTLENSLTEQEKAVFYSALDKISTELSEVSKQGLPDGKKK